MRISAAMRRSYRQRPYLRELSRQRALRQPRQTATITITVFATIRSKGEST